MIKKMNLKNKLLIGFLGSSLAFMPAAFAKSNDELSQNSIGIGYTFIDSDMKKGNQIDFNGKLVTDYGAFKLDVSETIGKQRIDPHKTNVVTNGNINRDFYNLEKGEIQEIKIGLGARKQVLDNILIGVKAGVGFGKGETKINSDVTGYQKQKGDGFLVGLSISDLKGNGLKLSYDKKNLKEQARFIGSSSDEKISTEILGFAYQLSFNNDKLQIIPSYIIEKETSDLNFKPFGLDRKIKHTKRILGIEAKLLGKNGDYVSLSLNLINGNQRHEFIEADTLGYKAGLEMLRYNLTLWVNGSYESNSSNSSLDTIDPSSFIPITLLFDEKRKKWNLKSGVSNSEFDLSLNYEVLDKSGSNEVFIPMFGVTMPLSDGNSTYKTLSADFGMNFGENNKLNLHAKKEFEHNGLEIGLGYTLKF